MSSPSAVRTSDTLRLSARLTVDLTSNLYPILARRQIIDLTIRPIPDSSIGQGEVVAEQVFPPSEETQKFIIGGAVVSSS